MKTMVRDRFGCAIILDRDEAYTDEGSVGSLARVFCGLDPLTGIVVISDHTPVDRGLAVGMLTPVLWVEVSKRAGTSPRVRSVNRVHVYTKSGCGDQVCLNIRQKLETYTQKPSETCPMLVGDLSRLVSRVHDALTPTPVG